MLPIKGQVVSGFMLNLGNMLNMLTIVCTDSCFVINDPGACIGRLDVLF